jgi:hypothetical protein
MQGGPCGQYIDLTTFDVAGAVTLHYPFEVIGAQDATHINYAQFYLGISQGVNMAGFRASFNFSAANLNNYGGTVYFTCGQCTQISNYQLAVGGTAQFSNSNPTTGSYNGACTNVQFNSATSLWSCTQASSVGATQATTATMTMGTNQYGNTDYKTYAGGEVLDVLDHSVNPPVIVNTGSKVTLTLEPNNAVWANGDTVEEPHHYAYRMNGLLALTQALDPMTSSANLASFTGYGAGFCCGLNYSPYLGASALALGNHVPTNTYEYHGGYVLPPGGITLGDNAPSSIFQWGLNMTLAPDPVNSSVLYIGCPVSGCTDSGYYYNIWQAKYVAPNTVSGLTFRPFYNEYTPSGNWNWSPIEFGKETFRDTITFGALAVPTLNNPTTATTGGTLPDASQYWYTVYATNSAGNTVQSAEKTITTGSGGGTNLINISWSRSQGATSYTLCRNSVAGSGTGTEVKGPTLTGADSTIFVDNGSQAWSGSCSTTDTTLGYVANASKVTLNSSGTAFTTTVIAPASQAGNVTVTPLRVSQSITPATATTGACAEQTFNTYTGLATGSAVFVSPPALVGAHVWIGAVRISAANTLAITFCADATGGTPAAGTYVAQSF